MRWIILLLVGIWTVLTVFAYTRILPATGRYDRLVEAYLYAAAELSDNESQHVLPQEVQRVVDAFAAIGSEIAGSQVTADNGVTQKDVRRLLSLPEIERQVFLDRCAAAFEDVTGRSLGDVPVLVWSTDDNPARRIQCQLFRIWHLKEYGEPIDIVTDPSNRDATKTIVQSAAGAGPDIIEAYGPAELGQFIDAGIALDVSERADADGFGVDEVFEVVRSSIARQDESGAWRQYAFPCNIGYTVLFYHRDVFAEAGLAEPSGPWSLEHAIEVAKELSGTEAEGGRRRVGIMNIGAWDMALAAGGRFLNEDGTASMYHSPATVGAFETLQSMMYEDRVMPSPAEVASMAASGGANMNAGAEAASASALFAAKVTAMYVGGRWEYVSLAHRNRDRVIVPAIDRRLAELAVLGVGDDAEAVVLREARASLLRDVLVPMSDEQRAALGRVLSDDDRGRLIQLGVAHVPTLTGEPFYSAAARVAIVNRASEKSEYAMRFLRFLASEAYNEQINSTFDSICGVPAFCFDEDGIAGPPSPLPGLEAFDSPVFAEAIRDYAKPWQLSPFIGRNRLGLLAGQVMERVTNNEIAPEEAAALIEERINNQIMANLLREPELRARWEAQVGVALDPDLGLREQVERARGGRDEGVGS